MKSPADPIHCGIVDTGVCCRPSTWCHSRHIGVSWKAYTLWHRGKWCLLQSLYIAAWATMMSPADPIHCGIVDTGVSCRPSASHHITSICIHAAAQYLLVTSVKGECLLLFLVTATLTSIFNNSQQCHKHPETVVWDTQHKKNCDGSHCVKWNNILFTEFSELLAISRMYKNI